MITGQQEGKAKSMDSRMMLTIGELNKVYNKFPRVRRTFRVVPFISTLTSVRLTTEGGERSWPIDIFNGGNTQAIT